MDVGSNNPYPAGALSNFTAHAFTFDGVACASMEGLLQSFKFNRVDAQLETCSLIGFKAKRRGEARSNAWKSVGKLWWKNVQYERDESEYQALLDRAFDALFTNGAFRKALKATGNEVLTRSIGNPDIWDTCLTEEEFCSRLMKLRDRL